MELQNFENILISGATGNSAYFFLKLLEEKNYKKKISVISRNKDKNNYFKQFNLNFNILNGDIRDKNFLSKCFENIDIVLHAANMENSINILEIGSKQKVKWFILVHSTMIFSKDISQFIKNRINIDKEIKEKYSNVTILNSSMIYGNDRDTNFSRLIKFMNKFMFFPIFGNGNNYMQPIYIEDLARSYYNVIKHKGKTFNKKYILAGKEPVRYIDILKTVKKKLNKKIIFIKIPIFLSVILVKIFRILSLGTLRINTSQIIRLTENKIYNYSDAQKDFSFCPRGFEEGIEIQINKYKENNLK